MPVHWGVIIHKPEITGAEILALVKKTLAQFKLPAPHPSAGVVPPYFENFGKRITNH